MTFSYSMNKIINYSLCAIVAAMSVCPVLAQTTQRLTANKTNEYGLIYSLPLTAIDVTVEAERTVRRPGEFYQYSRKYLNIDPITVDSEAWVIKSITLSSHGVADPEMQYIVQFKPGSTPFMVLDENSFPIAVNTENYPKPEPVALPVGRPAKPTVLETSAARTAVTEEMIQSKSSAKRAELAAAKIYELRQSRNDIISGQADQMPSDGKAMQLALDNLTSQEEALTAMFVGTEQTSTEVRTYTVIPDGTDHLHMIIGRLSQLGGLVDSEDLSGEPIYLDVTATRLGELPVNEKGEEKRFPKGGLAYCIPGDAYVEVTFDGRVFAERTMQLAQSGVVFGLDPTLFSDRKSPAYAIFNPSTGALVELGTKD